jgi:hypothetical protein
MPTICAFPLCKSYATDSGLCVSHGKIYKPEDLKGVVKRDTPASEPKKAVKKLVRKPIKKKSAKRSSQEKDYKKILLEMKAESDLCELKVPGVCTGKMEGLHHQKKRGANYLNRKYLRRACNACNGWCESHPLEAIEMGLSISKHKIEQ